MNFRIAFTLSMTHKPISQRNTDSVKFSSLLRGYILAVVEITERRLTRLLSVTAAAFIVFHHRMKQ
jgi:hypothetical protein